MHCFFLGLLAAYRIYQLPQEGWFKDTDEQLACINMAISTGVLNGLSRVPGGWLKGQRKQLSPDLLEQRTTISWDVPAADLHALLEEEEDSLASHAVYLGGTAFRLMLITNSKERRVEYLMAVFCTADYYQNHELLCPGAKATCCDFSIEQLGPAGRPPKQESSGMYTSCRLGWFCNVVKASTPADLAPFLVDGCLRIKGTIKPMQHI
jgi:hypothetical protein